MKLHALLAFVVVFPATVLPAHADFSYKVTRKSGGAMASVIGSQPSVSTYFYKGQKLKVDAGTRATIMDFDTRTVSTIDNVKKTVTVKSFDDLTSGAGSDAKIDAKIDVKETGAQKNVNGFDAFEAVLTMDIESPQARQMGTMHMEMDMWLSREVPGLDQLIAFHRKNEASFPWAAMQGGGGNASMQDAMAQAQRKIASMHGVPVQQVVRIKAPGGSPADSAQMSGAMAQARARLEAMQAQGGQQAAIAAQALARMGGGGASGDGKPSASLVEITSDSSDFSDAAIPDSVFAIPGDYQKIN